MGYIQPVSIPSAAGLSYGEGDVRHFSEGDGISVPGLANPTRHLAARDNLLAEKLNQTIAEVNNKEQIIPLPIYRMVMPPSSEEVVANHRIPSGYEARVLNAAISSTPNSSDIELSILWAEGFGNVSGTSLLTTSSESSGGTTFSPAGELVLTIKNKGSVTLDVVASVMVTMRPITDITGALLPAATVAPAGPQGAKGEKGEKGTSGSVGPAGSPGLNFKGLWAKTPYPVVYAPNDVVTHDFDGTSQRSAFVCLLGHIANNVNVPQPTLTPSPFWDFLAEAGSTGPTGSSGGAGANVVFASKSVNGTITTGDSFVAPAAPWNTAYQNGNVVAANTTYKVPLTEMTALNPTGTPAGLASLVGSFQFSYYGKITLTLPSVTWNAAATNYIPDSIKLIASVHGTEANPSGNMSTVPWIGPEVTPTANGWDVNVRGTTPIPVQLTVTGSQIVL